MFALQTAEVSGRVPNLEVVLAVVHQLASGVAVHCNISHSFEVETIEPRVFGYGGFNEGREH